MEMFAQKFIAARDKGLSPTDSWKRREAFWRNGHISRHAREYEDIALSFTSPLQFLAQEDFESVLLAGAQSEALYMTIYVHPGCMTGDASFELLLRYHQAFILPLLKRGVMGGASFAGFSDIEKCGFMLISLFPFDAVPRELQLSRFISGDDVHALLTEAGCTQVSMPPQRTH